MKHWSLDPVPQLLVCHPSTAQSKRSLRRFDFPWRSNASTRGAKHRRMTLLPLFRGEEIATNCESGVALARLVKAAFDQSRQSRVKNCMIGDLKVALKEPQGVDVMRRLSPIVLYDIPSDEPRKALTVRGSITIGQRLKMRANFRDFITVPAMASS